MPSSVTRRSTRRSTWTKGEIIYKQYINVGVAVDTEHRGLSFPVMRNVDRMTIPEIARLGHDDAEGPQHGVYDRRSPRRHVHHQQHGRDRRHLLDADHQLAGSGDSAGRPFAASCRVIVDGKIEPRLMMPFSLSYDHRVIDGGAAARFLNDVIGYLQAPGRRSLMASITSASWPSTLTFFQTWAILPSASIRKVERWMPIAILTVHVLFAGTVLLGHPVVVSARGGKLRWYLSRNLSWLSTVRADAQHLDPQLGQDRFAVAERARLRVHPGVSSFG